MVHRLAWTFLLLALTGPLTGRVGAETFLLLNGEALSGDPVAYDEKGVIVKRADGSFAPKMGWTNFTQSALKQLAEIPKAKPFAEVFLEEEEAPAAKKPVAIKINEPPRLDRPDPKAGLGSLFGSSLGFAVLLVLYLANIYAGYEISIFRNYHPALVCGVAAVVPVAGPIAFLSLPTRLVSHGEEAAVEESPAAALHDDQAAAFEMASAPQTPAAAPGAPGTPAPAPAVPAPTVYRRGHTTFNRRFFETKFAGFLRLVPSDAEKDMVIQVRSARGEHVGSRISRILPNELCLQISKAGASSDVTIPYTEITEVIVRHKDA